MKTYSRAIWGLMIVLLPLLAACGGLSSEPEIAVEMPLPTAAPQAELAAAPASVPDAAAGAAFYADHCVMCHGTGGQGDGEMVADGRLQTPPPDFTDPATLRDKTPADFMQAVTEGNVLAGMPPFASYTEQERWNVVAYVYGGGLMAEQIAVGQAIYETACTRCHGQEGHGDGADAAEIMPDLASLDYWGQTSNAAVYTAVSQGMAPVMPAFADQLDETELNAVTAFVRALAVPQTASFAIGTAAGMAQAEVAPTAVPEAIETISAAETEPTAVADAAASQPEATAEPAEVAAPEFVTIRGEVVNGTDSAAVPEGATLTLHLFDPPDFQESTVEATLNADGTYLFEGIPYVEGRAYLLSLQYQGVFFSSTVYSVNDPANPVLDTGIEIFETTNDVSVVAIDAGVMRITFGDLGMEVIEVLSIENTSDRLFLTDEHLNENQRIALRFPLPPGAGGVGFEPGMENQRFVVSDDGTTVYDTQPVRPGSQDIFMSFFIPYEDGAIIDQVFEYPFQGAFHLLMEDGPVTVTSGPFDGGSQTVDMGGENFQAYVAQIDHQAGDVLSFTVSGEPGTAAATTSDGGSNLSPVVIALLVAGLILIGAGGFIFLLRQGTTDPDQRRIDDLLEQIAELDDQHDQGMLNHDYYQRTRAALKAELGELMRSSDGDDEGAA